LFVGVGLGLLDDAVGAAEAVRERDERRAGGDRLAEEPRRSRPGSLLPSRPAAPEWLGCGRGPNTLSGVFGPPNRPSPTRTRAPTRKMLPATPTIFISRLR